MYSRWPAWAHTLELTDDHEGELEAAFDGLAVDLVGKVREAHVSVHFLRRLRRTWTRNTKFPWRHKIKIVFSVLAPSPRNSFTGLSDIITVQWSWLLSIKLLHHPVQDCRSKYPIKWWTHDNDNLCKLKLASKHCNPRQSLSSADSCHWQCCSRDVMLLTSLENIAPGNNAAVRCGTPKSLASARCTCSSCYNLRVRSSFVARERIALCIPQQQHRNTFNWRRTKRTQVKESNNGKQGTVDTCIATRRKAADFWASRILTGTAERYRTLKGTHLPSAHCSAPSSLSLPRGRARTRPSRACACRVTQTTDRTWSAQVHRRAWTPRALLVCLRSEVNRIRNLKTNSSHYMCIYMYLEQ